jgi:hypothetical protein
VLVIDPPVPETSTAVAGVAGLSLVVVFMALQRRKSLCAKVN